jgi:hypothetical protein
MSKKNNGNVEFCIENGKIETVTSNLSSTYLTSTIKRGQTGSLVGSNGVIASPIIISSHPPTPPPQELSSFIWKFKQSFFFAFKDAHYHSIFTENRSVINLTLNLTTD